MSRPNYGSLRRILRHALDGVIRIDLKGDGGNDGQELLPVLKITLRAA